MAYPTHRVGFFFGGVEIYSSLGVGVLISDENLTLFRHA